MVLHVCCPEVAMWMSTAKQYLKQYVACAVAVCMHSSSN
jgi:hypothetical protein